MAQFYHPGTLPSEFRCNVSAITSDIIKLAKGLNVLIELKMAQKICVGIALGKKKNIFAAWCCIKKVKYQWPKKSFLFTWNTYLLWSTLASGARSPSFCFAYAIQYSTCFLLCDGQALIQHLVQKEVWLCKV